MFGRPWGHSVQAANASNHFSVRSVQFPSWSAPSIDSVRSIPFRLRPSGPPRTSPKSASGAPAGPS
eukprot:8235028-Alexandrium_andersonii.AAC.1